MGHDDFPPQGLLLWWELSHSNAGQSRFARTVEGALSAEVSMQSYGGSAH